MTDANEPGIEETIADVQEWLEKQKQNITRGEAYLAILEKKKAELSGQKIGPFAKWHQGQAEKKAEQANQVKIKITAHKLNIGGVKYRNGQKVELDYIEANKYIQSGNAVLVKGLKDSLGIIKAKGNENIPLPTDNLKLNGFDKFIYGSMVAAVGVGVASVLEPALIGSAGFTVSAGLIGMAGLGFSTNWITHRKPKQVQAQQTKDQKKQALSQQAQEAYERSQTSISFKAQATHPSQPGVSIEGWNELVASFHQKYTGMALADRDSVAANIDDEPMSWRVVRKEVDLKSQAGLLALEQMKQNGMI